MAALVLAAGAGTRLRPISDLRPKALCPVGNVALVDSAVERVATVVGPAAVAVNVHDRRAELEAHLDGRVHLSVEEPVALGTAGAVAHLAPWLDGRPVLVVNGDTWHRIDLAPLAAGWDGGRVRVAVLGAAVLGPTSRIVASLLPSAAVGALRPEPSGLWEVCWRDALAAGRLDVVGVDGDLVDCGRPADYLAANLLASGGASVVGEGAEVAGELVRSVVWPGGVVRRGEVLVDAVRVGERWTVLVR